MNINKLKLRKIKFAKKMKGNHKQNANREKERET